MSRSRTYGNRSATRARSNVRSEPIRPRTWLIENLYRVTTIFAFLILLPLAVILQNGVGFDGDSPFYFAVQQALLGHGWPNITPPLAEQVARELRIADLFQDGRVIRGLDGAVYGVHFWLYPLLSVPFALPFAVAGGDPLYGFLLLNAATYAGCAWVIGRSPALGPVGRSVLLLSLAITTIHWYVSWPHPEVFTACLLVIASVLLLEGRFVNSAILAGIAATHNPSAVLMFAAVGAFQLHALWRDRPPLAPAVVRCAVQLLPGLVIAAIPYIWSLAMFGVANPIVANGYIDYTQIGWRKLASLLFDWNQGFALGFPFLLTVLGLVVFERLRAWGRGAGVVLRIEDVLIVAVLAMAIPVLAQVNFNAGQHYVSRYAAWLAAPMIVWVALVMDRETRMASLVAWLGGVGLYGLSYLLFFAHKVHYVLVSVPNGAPVYQEQMLFKPLAALVLSLAPGLYNPWPEIFIERSLRQEVAVASPAAPLAVGYTSADGAYLKIATRATEAETVSQALCPPAESLTDGRDRPLTLDRTTDAGLGYRYLTGPYRCR